MGSGLLLKRSIEKYGIDKFKKEILYDFQTDKEMFDMEKEIVNEEFISRDDTYNITTGGNGSWTHTKGTITVEDKEGNTSRISVNDPRYLSGELTYIGKNKVNVKDKDGNIFRILKNDPRFLSGELVGNTKNTVVVQDKIGNRFRVDVNDPSFITGEFISISKNKIVVQDKKGERFIVDRTDPRFLSGEIVYHWSGRKHKPETNLKRKQTMAERKHSQGEKNSHFGKVWVYNLELKKSLSVKKEEVEKFLSEGWIKGRKIKFQ